MYDSPRQQTDQAIPPPLRVAVIEDDRIMRTMLEKLLSKTESCTLTGSWSTGEASLAALPGLRPDVIVIDFELPDISGEDCIRAFRSAPLHRSSPPYGETRPRRT